MSTELLEDSAKDNAVAAPQASRSRAILLIPLLLLLILGVLLALNLGKDPKLVPSPFIGKPAPVFNAVDLLNGEKIGTETLRGQAYILNVWASWCVVCQIEHRHFNAYAKTPNALPVIGLNYKDAPEDAKRWLAQLGNPYQQIAVDSDGKIGLDFGVYGAPETYFIDRQGIVRFKHIGEITPEVLIAQTKLIDGAP
jgi:cytochrome c biogenesis protein CcmG, thiol:disulfide interchange protein DsbE